MESESVRERERERGGMCRYLSVSMCALKRGKERMCTLTPTAAFQQLILLHIPSRGNSKQMAQGSSEVCFIPFSAVSDVLKVSGWAASRDRGQMQGQRGEDYSRYTSDKSVSLIIDSDPSCGRPCFQAGVSIRG